MATKPFTCSRFSSGEILMSSLGKTAKIFCHVSIFGFCLKSNFVEAENLLSKGASMSSSNLNSNFSYSKLVSFMGFERSYDDAVCLSLCLFLSVTLYLLFVMVFYTR